MDMLEAVGNHLIEVTKFLRMISVTPNSPEEPFDIPDKTTPKQVKSSQSASKKPPTNNGSLRAIQEEDPQAVNSLSDNVADFSLERI